MKSLIVITVGYSPIATAGHKGLLANDWLSQFFLCWKSHALMCANGQNTEHCLHLGYGHLSPLGHPDILAYVYKCVYIYIHTHFGG